MLGEFTGALQICTCAMIIVATFTWFQALRAGMKQVDLVSKEFWRLQIDVIHLTSQVENLNRLAKIHHDIEKNKETLANLHAKE
jgi:hypothetical protein